MANREPLFYCGAEVVEGLPSSNPYDDIEVVDGAIDCYHERATMPICAGLESSHFSCLDPVRCRHCPRSFSSDMRRHVRFGIGSEDGERFSPTFKAKASARGDVYISSSHLPESLHISVHDDPDHWNISGLPSVVA